MCHHQRNRLSEGGVVNLSAPDLTTPLVSNVLQLPDVDSTVSVISMTNLMSCFSFLFSEARDPELLTGAWPVPSTLNH